MGLNSDSATKLREIVASSQTLSDQELLERALVLTSVWRSKLWANTVAVEGTQVRSGPFKGLDYVVRSAEGALLPRLLGIYERELHPDILAFAADDLDHVIDIGCAEGYYAVGMARLMPGTTVYAYDINAAARRRCATLAAHNGVGDRVIVREEFRGEAFEQFRGTRSLVFIDAEGFEDDVLRPDLYPALAELNIIVETHPMYRSGVTDRLIERFEATHVIERIDSRIDSAELDGRISRASHLDLMLAGWEWRSGPTPWLVMRPRVQPSAASRA